MPLEGVNGAGDGLGPGFFFFGGLGIELKALAGGNDGEAVLLGGGFGEGALFVGAGRRGREGGREGW